MIHDALLEAIENGKPLRVRYFGGSSPGAERELQPLAVNDGKVRARCIPSGETKTFVVEKMELAVEGCALRAGRHTSSSANHLRFRR